jgi:hypothetical protein
MLTSRPTGAKMYAYKWVNGVKIELKSMSNMKYLVPPSGAKTNNLIFKT